MEVQLTWDIVFIAVFFVLFGVTLLRPHKFTLRLLFGTYISLMVAEGAALFLERVLLPASPGLQASLAENSIEVFIGVRLVLFIAAIVLFLIHGHYNIEHKHHNHWLARLVIHILFALLASLLLSLCFFVFLSGDSALFVLMGNPFAAHWLDKSVIVRPLLHTFGIWVVLPAVGMWLANIFGPKD